MTFEAYEESTETGQPVELYDIRIGAEVFLYTNNQLPITVSSLTYTPLAISRAKLSLSAEGHSADRLEIRMPGDNAFVRKFVTIVPGKRAILILRRIHRIDAGLEVIVQYKGAVQSVSFSENADIASLQIAPLTAAKSRQMPRLTYQSLCGHMLYDERCKISDTDPAFEKFLIVEAVTAGGLVLQLDGANTFGFADFFVNGFVEYLGDFRLITAQAGELCTLLLPFNTSPLGIVVRCLAGCKHRGGDCKNKFDNYINFGGFPMIPTKNIFRTGLD